MNVFGIPLGKGKYQRLISFIWKFAAFGFGSFIIYLVAVNFNLFWMFGQMPNIEDLDNPKSEIASEIISSDGKVIGKYFFQNRTPVDFDDLPASLIDALISTEDVRFTRHAGIDARSMLRVIGGILTFNRKGGGSTISQQLAKNLFQLRQDEKYIGPIYEVPGLRTLVIKTKEWITALKLERIYTKQEIMKLYLDTIEFSSGAYGIKAAAKTYFNKPVTNLTVNESALLVGMIQNPSRFNPNLRPQNATGRRNIVLSQMVKYGKIESAKLEAYQKEAIVLDYNPASHNSGLAPYFREFLKDWAKAEIEKLGYEPEDLYTKGFKIYTTIDSRMQRYAEEAVAEHMTDQQKKFDEHWKGQNPWVQRASENSSRYVEIPGFIERMASRTGYYQSLKRKYGNDKEKIMAG
ncbi:MAG: transglycosylase domain-containing protein, partial [Spirosomataceae bacterium]